MESMQGISTNCSPSQVLPHQGFFYPDIKDSPDRREGASGNLFVASSYRLTTTSMTGVPVLRLARTAPVVRSNLYTLAGWEAGAV